MNAADFMLELGRHSVEAALLVLVVMALQWVLRSHLAPQWVCALWLLVMLRLLPFSVVSGFSVFNFLPRWEAIGSGAGSSTGNGASKAAVEVRARAQVPSTDEVDAAALNDGIGSRPGPRAPAIGGNIWVRLNRWTVLFEVWLGGVIFLGGYVVCGAASLSWRLRRQPAIEDAGTQRVLRECCDRLGIGRGPIVVESREVATPGLHGLLRPRLLLPPGFTAAFSEDELRFVFLHELAHLKRRDLALNWIAATLQVVHWFNPVVWFGFARWRADREIACDAIAVEAAGAARNTAYGHTILRLLECFSLRASRPGLVGIIESKRDLQRRMRMIAGYRPARRPVVAVTLMVALAVGGLTDAQVEPPAEKTMLPQGATLPPLMGLRLDGQAVVFLVQASDSMMGETAEEVARLHDETENQRRATPKWRRAIHTLEWMVASLDPNIRFQILFFNDDVVPVLPGRSSEWFNTSDRPAIKEIVAELDRAVPHGGANLERAFAAVQTLAQRPDRSVLMTDGLPTISDSLPGTSDSDENQRVRNLEVAAKQLPPRIPISTVLLPFLPGDQAAAGLYWELANATRGALVCPAKSWPAAAGSVDRIAIVIDTSGSMRDPNGGGIWPIVGEKIQEVLNSNPNLSGVQILDANGRFILGLPDKNAGGWLADTPGLGEQIKAALRQYDQESVSNPVPGIYRALRSLDSKETASTRMSVYVMGDELNTTDTADDLCRRLDEVNPRDASGNRRIVINAIGFPTTVRYNFSMRNTGVRFASLMRIVTQEHGGMFVALPDL